MGVPSKADLTRHKIARWMALGTDPKVIASRVGLDKATVNAYIKQDETHALSRHYAELIASGELDDLLEGVQAQKILESAAPRAAEKTVELMDSALDESLQFKAAESVLDRTGHAKQTEIKRTTIVLDAGAAQLIESTRQMLEPVQEADFELLPQETEDVGPESDQSGSRGSERGQSGRLPGEGRAEE